MAETMEPMMAINQAINAVVEERKCREKVKSSSSSESRTSAERRRRASPRDDQEQIPIGLGAGSMGLNSSEVRRAATKQLRIVTLGWGTRGDRKRPLQRWTNPKLSRRTCTCECGLQSCRGKSAGVAKRPRERSPPKAPKRNDSLLRRCASGSFAPSLTRGVLPPSD
jgi:hypothetical protein